MPNKPESYPYIVSFLDPEAGDLRWKPKQPDGGLDTAMVPAFQRGGIHGDFQTVQGEIEMELFIPFSSIKCVETRASFEKRLLIAKAGK